MKIYQYILFLAVATMAEEIDLDRVLNYGSKQFTAKMFSEVAKSNMKNSFVLSAFSVMPPLAQLALASVDESQDEILNAIGMPNDNITKAAFSFITTKLRSVKGITLNTANKIYIGENYELNDDFAAISRETFGSDIEKIDFTEKEKSAKHVNSWVEEQTNHRIKNLVKPDQINADTRALLVNAIYFKGMWKTSFDKRRTRDKKFYITKEKQVDVPTMYNKGYYKYTENQELNAQILEISYKGDESSFVIVLPREIDGISELEEKLKDPSALDKAMNEMRNTEVEVYLPKFKIETTTNLKNILKNIDVKRLFTPGLAKLQNLIKDTQDMCIQAAMQKAFIEINEEGAEAAAANVFYAIQLTSANYFKKNPPKFIANRPFYFAVKANSMTLFNGVMRNV